MVLDGAGIVDSEIQKIVRNEYGRAALIRCSTVLNSHSLC